MGRAATWLPAALWAAGAAAQTARVDFARDVQPIFLSRCAACHLGENRLSGLSLHTRADILKGGQLGPAVVPGSSRDSLLIQRVSGFSAPSMPMGAEPLTERQIAILRAWVDQGAAGPSADAPARRTAPLALRRPAVPGGAENPVDAFVAAFLARQGAEFPRPVSDAVFARRVYFDLWGLPPTPEQLDEFLLAPNREPLIDQLLANRKNYAEHWISFWNDLLRNDEGVVYHGARQSITAWLLKALEENLPYDQMVSALLNPTRKEDPAGYLIGVNWRGDINASQVPAMQAAQNSAQVFLGVNLKCNSCHDSFISSWKLTDAYGMAAFFANEPLEIHRCDVRTGEKASPKFLFPELGEGVGGSLEERRAAVARLFLTPENGRTPRTLVNRYWRRLFGRGLVEPVDDMDAEPWDADLLDWLAADFAAHNYDLKRLLRQILTSRAYQLPAAGRGDESFRGPRYRRLTAEQLVDSVSSITGQWRVLQPTRAAAGTYARDWRLKSTPLTRVLGRPIRDQVYTGRSEEPATLQAIELVNGDTLRRLLSRGAQRLLGTWKQPPANIFDSGAMRAEKVTVDIDITGARALRLLLEDFDSYDPERVVAGWANAELVSPAGITRLADLAPSAKAQKRALRIKGEAFAEALVTPVPTELVYDIAGKDYTRFRAVVGVDETSLQNDINPRVRFFVFTEEPDRQHLVRVAETGAGGRGSGAGASAQQLVPRLYRHALARAPTAEERRLAEAMDLEDLLWSLFMSPEFQYIR